MALFRRILVAIDGSRTSNMALRAAIKLAKDQQSDLRIVFVVDQFALAAEAPEQSTEYQVEERRAGDLVLKRAAALAHKAGIEAETVRLEVQTLHDRIADEISRNARKWRADVIVIGSHGRRGLSRLFMGSVAESLARIASAPVLLIRGR
jgi:nucleotide-binding universal stress UspA family protein